MITASEFKNNTTLKKKIGFLKDIHSEIEKFYRVAQRCGECGAVREGLFFVTESYTSARWFRSLVTSPDGKSAANELGVDLEAFREQKKQIKRMGEKYLSLCESGRDEYEGKMRFLRLPLNPSDWTDWQKALYDLEKSRNEDFDDVIRSHAGAPAKTTEDEPERFRRERAVFEAAQRVTLSGCLVFLYQSEREEFKKPFKSTSGSNEGGAVSTVRVSGFAESRVAIVNVNRTVSKNTVVQSSKSVAKNRLLADRRRSENYGKQQSPAPAASSTEAEPPRLRRPAPPTLNLSGLKDANAKDDDGGGHRSCNSNDSDKSKPKKFKRKLGALSERGREDKPRRADPALFDVTLLKSYGKYEDGPKSKILLELTAESAYVKDTDGTFVRASSTPRLPSGENERRREMLGNDGDKVIRESKMKSGVSFLSASKTDDVLGARQAHSLKKKFLPKKSTPRPSAAENNNNNNNNNDNIDAYQTSLLKKKRCKR